MAKIVVSCPGSCGELIQGVIDNQLCLVSCGINAFSYAFLDEDEEQSNEVGEKVKKAVNLTLEKLGEYHLVGNKMNLSIKTELPISKGMASSTADIAAASYAIGLHYGKSFLPEDISAICTSIESTDSTMYNALTLFNAKKGNIVRQDAWKPVFYIMVLEPEETLDTEQFHTDKNDVLFKNQEEAFKEVYELYLESVYEKDMEKLGEAATRSAILNQDILKKPYFKDILEIKEKYVSVFGINVAHSGTVVGILLNHLDDRKSIIETLNQKHITSIYTNIKVYKSCFDGVRQYVKEVCHEESIDRSCF